MFYNHRVRFGSDLFFVIITKHRNILEFISTINRCRRNIYISLKNYDIMKYDTHWIIYLKYLELFVSYDEMK